MTMLIQFTIGNYRSIREPQCISMVTRGSLRHEPQNLFQVVAYGHPLLKSAILYGANASGKSNLVRGMLAMQALVHQRGVQDSLAKALLAPFRLTESPDTTPLHVEMELISQGQRFRYGFECLPDRIVSEWLYAQKRRMVLMFARKNNSFVHQSPDCTELATWNKILADTTLTLPEDALFLPTAAKMFAGGACEKVCDWFENTLVILSADTFHQYLDYTLATIRQPDMARKVERLIEKADFGINALQPIFVENTASGRGIQVVTKHQIQNKSYTLDMFNDESQGTQKVFALSAPLLDVLNRGKVLIIDELDASLHPLLASQLIELFHSSNHANAQIIATAHSPSLLTETTFRRDQVWFVNKNDEGATSFVSLASFSGIRGNFNQIVRDYLHGCYGAVPTIPNLNLETQE